MDKAERVHERAAVTQMFQQNGPIMRILNDLESPSCLDTTQHFWNLDVNPRLQVGTNGLK